jgi:NAD+ synthase (glutamine-hydrolysing)
MLASHLRTRRLTASSVGLLVSGQTVPQSTGLPLKRPSRVESGAEGIDANLMARPFFSLYSHGFVRVAVCIPRVRVGDPAFNAERTIALARRASDASAAVAVFPELGISAYAIDDLLQQDALLDAVELGLQSILEASSDLTPIILAGAPLRFEHGLFDCAVAIYRGQVLGVQPKTYLPNYREFYEKRQFSAGREAIGDEISLLGRHVPFGNDLIFTASTLPGFAVHAEICEDVWTPIPPSTHAALAGATILANLSASNVTIGKSAYRHTLCASQSGRCVAAYLYAAAGMGESTTDLAWDGQGLIYENGELLAESSRFSEQDQLIVSDVDLDRLRQERMRLTSFGDTAADYRERLRHMRTIEFAFEVPAGEIGLARRIERFPYVPSGAVERDERSYEAYNIQVRGLMSRLQSTGIKKAVIGVSGGLDSTQALLVATQTMDRLGLPRENVLAFSMPGFATSDLTRSNALALMSALGVTAAEIDIRPSCLQMLRDLGHPFAGGEPLYDITFENVQAGERTSHLFRLANYHAALVVGTGDLSELGLGWATYGVGDQMSHYNVNVSVPKTLIQYLIRWVIASGQFDAGTNAILDAILGTEISPELVPHADGDRAKPAQSTQEKIGPYELQDFNLYYTTRFGFRPSKVAFLAHSAWSDRTRGDWPEGYPNDQRHEYDMKTIVHWLEVFLYRFFTISQFKRSAVPNGPKVGSGGSLSPRGDWRAPSDGDATAWLAELRQNVPG